MMVEKDMEALEAWIETSDGLAYLHWLYTKDKGKGKSKGKGKNKGKDKGKYNTGGFGGSSGSAG